MIERRAERRLERAEPRFIILPYIDAVAVDRAPHLFGARRADRALVGVELEAGPIERHADEIEQPPDFAFGIVDQALVEDAVNGAWLDVVEMGHEPPIIAVEGAGRFEA